MLMTMAKVLMNRQGGWRQKDGGEQKESTVIGRKTLAQKKVKNDAHVWAVLKHAEKK